MATRTRMTLAQFLAMEDTEPASEYACREAIQKPMPDFAHTLLRRYLALVLLRYPEQRRLGNVFQGWCCIFGPPGREARVDA